MSIAHAAAQPTSPHADFEFILPTADELMDGGGGENSFDAGSQDNSRAASEAAEAGDEEEGETLNGPDYVLFTWWDETSRFDDHWSTKWVDGAEYYQRLYGCMVPSNLTDDGAIAEWIEENDGRITWIDVPPPKTDTTIPLPLGTDAEAAGATTAETNGGPPLSSETAGDLPATSATDPSAPLQPASCTSESNSPGAPARDDLPSPGTAGQPGEGWREFQESSSSWMNDFQAIQERHFNVSMELRTAKERAKVLRKLLDEIEEEAANIKARKPVWSNPSTAYEAMKEYLDPPVNSPAAAALADDLSNLDPNAWRSIPISQLSLKASVEAKLLENDVTTIGQLEDLRAKGSGPGVGLRSVKGIGQAKADAIEDALLAWLTENRDKAAFSQPGRSDGGRIPADQVDSPANLSGEGEDTEGFSLPLPSDVEASPLATCSPAVQPGDSPLSTSTPSGIAAHDPDAQRAAAIEALAAELMDEERLSNKQLGSPDPLSPQCESEKYWDAGFEAWNKGDPVRDCPWEDEAMGDWIRGWLAAMIVGEHEGQGEAAAAASDRQES